MIYNMMQIWILTLTIKETTTKFLIEVKDVSFGYNPENLLFKNITFALSRGETLGIIGKNGKGKSTLLNVIAGELKALTGSVDYHTSTVFGHFGQTNISLKQKQYNYG